MKKIISIFLICVIATACLSPATAAQDFTKQVTIIAFENYSVTEDSLTSEKRSVMEADAEWIISGSDLKVHGHIPGGNLYNVSITIENGKFVDATEEYNNYTVLSIISFTDIIRIILKDNRQNNMYYVEMDDNRFSTVEAYNISWYHSFLAPSVETMDTATPQTVTSTYKTFSTTTTIYGDVYKEILLLQFYNDWDNPVTTGVGFTATTKMILKSKTTEITRYGTSTPVVQVGNSLFVNQVTYSAVTPAGEYFRKVESQFKGTIYRSGSVGIGVGIGIPNTPFSVDLLSLPQKETQTIGSSASYFSVDENYAAAAQKTMAIEVYYTDSNTWLENAENESGVLHQIIIENYLKTHDNYIILGNKGFGYRWDYRVASDGNCNGVAVTMFSEPQSFRNTLYYTLKQS